MTHSGTHKRTLGTADRVPVCVFNCHTRHSFIKREFLFTGHSAATHKWYIRTSTYKHTHTRTERWASIAIDELGWVKARPCQREEPKSSLKPCATLVVAHYPLSMVTDHLSLSLPLWNPNRWPQRSAEVWHSHVSRTAAGKLLGGIPAFFYRQQRAVSPLLHLPSRTATSRVKAALRIDC